MTMRTDGYPDIIDAVDHPQSATQRVASELRAQIIRGDYRPGEKLKVEVLKTQLNSGASPIREALSLLTSDQLVERIDQRGFRVAAVSASQFREILSLRCELDIIALRNSIENGHRQWEDTLVLAHHRLAQANRKTDERWEHYHKVFHATLLNACDSPILFRFCMQLYDLNVRYRNLAGESVLYRNRDIATEHKELLDTTLARDAVTACEKLAQHYQLTGDYLADQLDQV